MHHFPCYIGRDLVGFIEAPERVQGSRLRFLASAEKGHLHSPAIRTVEYELQRMGFSIDTDFIKHSRNPQDVLHGIINELERQGVPIGVTKIEVLRRPERMMHELHWLGVSLTLDEHEILFDEPYYFDAHNKSKLIYDDLARETLSALAH